MAEEMEGEFGQVIVQDITTQWGVFAIAGPNSRAILKELVRDADPATALGNKRFPWLSMRNIELGMCPVRAIRVAYTGELGWELHHPIEFGRYLWDQLVAAGEKHGLKLVGARAQNWLRQEKSYRASAPNSAATRRRWRPGWTALSIWTRRSTASRQCWTRASAANA